ncbi:sulfurtransferase [Desulfatitalea alkaliphila]|uniref:Sulfurtransferase n=1 Tax=Desulfatitalea alkaliphila TaxID=2929485 RepID=A0AA41QZB5_9BACT|nr:rhodanese-like domain-containing protein [Desulfatitalea alkaliphila]MCJ8499014.1 sulfurtransferase [Desulfatitalea alkaliphila]
METTHRLRYAILALILFLSLLWSLASASQQENSYPNSRFIAHPQWLKAHLEDTDLVIADVRTDDHFDGALIPGAIRLPWSKFRFNDIGNDVATTFIGIAQAQDILGRHGITPKDTIVLYDSVERDGGATASYVFWVLDILGHENKKILVRGIDGWKDAGYDLVTTPRETKPLLYQAPAKKIQKQQLITGNFVYKQLGDFCYQIIDVRSREEYMGEKGTKGLDGTPLKLGHIPTAVNINYQNAWTDMETKAVKSYARLQNLYAGLDASKAVIVYCNSGRRSAFSYFILRLMGFERVYTYEKSWKEWGNPDRFFPVETRENKLASSMLPTPSTATRTVSSQKSSEASSSDGSGSGKPAGGYISCGG